MNGKIKIFLKYYLPALIWAGIIFYFSSVPGLEYGSISNVKETILRKGAHFFEYAVLSFLLWRIFYQGHRLHGRPSFWLALILSILYAASDEIHQHFVFARTGKAVDVFFDSFSALLTLDFLEVYARRRFRRKDIFMIVFSVIGLVGLGLFMVREASIRQSPNHAGEAMNLPDAELDGGSAKKDEPKSDEVSEEEPQEEEEVVLPGRVSIDVPFTSQAPYANWDEVHEETCEEASLVMLKYFLTGEKLDKETAEKELLAMVEFQKNNYGDYKDSNAEDTVRLAEDFYGLKNLRVVYDFSSADLKKYLARKKPILVPAAGRLLGNPNFTYPGPLYHMLVLTGYRGNTVITNDPGTRKGEGYKYDLEVLFEAIHDFPGDKNRINEGRKAMIVSD